MWSTGETHGKHEDSKVSSKQEYGPQIAAACIFVLGVIYYRLINRDLKRMGSDLGAQPYVSGTLLRELSNVALPDLMGRAGQIVQVFGHIYNNISGGGGGTGGPTGNGGDGGGTYVNFNVVEHSGNIPGGGGGTGESGDIDGSGGSREEPHAESSSGGHLGDISGGIGGPGGSGRIGGRGGDAEGPRFGTMPGGYNIFGGTGGGGGAGTDAGGEGGTGGGPIIQ
ncbi:hypothetical protein FB451DRAFT_1285677 [Mycena latifolia]|nr:hypothetical protein FB451DRAFT_1285677 [Mycena latifolia]